MKRTKKEKKKYIYNVRFLFSLAHTSIFIELFFFNIFHIYIEIYNIT